MNRLKKIDSLKSKLRDTDELRSFEPLAMPLDPNVGNMLHCRPQFRKHYTFGDLRVGNKICQCWWCIPWLLS